MMNQICPTTNLGRHTSTPIIRYGQSAVEWPKLLTPSISIACVPKASVTQAVLRALQVAHPVVILTGGNDHATGRNFEIHQGFRHLVIRVDDYPTGIRPIPVDKAGYYSAVREIDEMGIPYELGISPLLMDDEDVYVLKQLKHVRPALHGLDHNYFAWSRKLRRRGDPFNEAPNKILALYDKVMARVPGGPTLCEFSRDDFENVLFKLKLGKRMLETLTGNQVDCYIPPFNSSNPNVGKALAACGFKVFLSQRPIPCCDLFGIISERYGDSNSLDFGPTTCSVCLHTTWEWDLARTGTGRKLERIVKLNESVEAAVAALEVEVADWARSVC